MKVKATKDGFYGSLRRPGDVFEVADGVKSKWFEPVDANAKPEKPAKADKGKRAPETLSEITRADSEALGGDIQV